MNPWTLILAALALLILPMLLAVLLLQWQRAAARRRTGGPDPLTGGADDWRLARLERRVDRVVRHLHLDVDEDRAIVAELVRSGQTAEAVHAFQDLIGAELQDARDAVEALARALEAVGGSGDS